MAKKSGEFTPIYIWLLMLIGGLVAILIGMSMEVRWLVIIGGIAVVTPLIPFILIIILPSELSLVISNLINSRNVKGETEGKETK